MREQLVYYAVKYHGEWHKIKHALESQEVWESVPCAESYITIEDEKYPERLRRLSYAPWVLFYEGNLDLLHTQAVAVIGGRIFDAYGKHMCQHIVDIVKQQYTIVSGMAKGIDAIAHTNAMDHHTIGVIGCGLDICYPKENKMLYEQMKQTQLVLSEYPRGTKPLAYHFPWRNRILAALSNAVVVIQANKRSGTLLTVNEALQLNIPIYCVPHHFQEPCGEGCNLLISQGAEILLDDMDIYEI